MSPNELGLEITATRAESADWGASNPTPSPGDGDRDDHHVAYEVVPMRGRALLELTVRRGMSPQAAAALLRKLAGWIDRHGETLLELPRGGYGWFTPDGDLIDHPPAAGAGKDASLVTPDVGP